MNKIKNYNVVCTYLNNRCHLTCIERTGSIVSVFLGKVDLFCAYPRNKYKLSVDCLGSVFEAFMDIFMTFKGIFRQYRLFTHGLKSVLEAF